MITIDTIISHPSLESSDNWEKTGNFNEFFRSLPKNPELLQRQEDAGTLLHPLR